MKRRPELIFAGVLCFASLASGQSGARLTVTPASLTFTMVAGGDQPPHQTLSIGSSGAPLTYFIATRTENGRDWLYAGPFLSGVTPGSLVAGLNPSQIVGPMAGTDLPPGTYTGSIVITAANAANSPLTVPVTLTVTASAGTPRLAVAPASLAFSVQVGGRLPGFQTLAITSTGAPVAYTIVPNTASGGSWLNVGPLLAGTTPESSTVGLNPTALVGLAAGTYTGSIVISAANAANSPVTVPVTLTVSAPGPAVQASPSSLSFSLAAGGPAPPPQTVTISSSGSQLAYAIVVRTTSGGDWLYAGPLLAGNTPGSLVVGLTPSPIAGSGTNAGDLPPGTYSGSVIVAGQGANTISVDVTLNVTPPAPAISRVANAASLGGNPVAPGEMIAIFGSRLGPAIPVFARIPASGALDRFLADVRVFFDDTPAVPLYVSSNQVNVIAPQSLSSSSSTRLRVWVGASASAPLDVPIYAANPGIFTSTGSGTGQGAILNQDFTLNSAANPAPRGSIVTVYATGGGPMNPATDDAAIVTRTGATTQPVAAAISGQRAEVLYAGPVVSLVPGVLQVNVRIPDGVAANPFASINLSVGERFSQPGVTVAIR